MIDVHAKLNYVENASQANEVVLCYRIGQVQICLVRHVFAANWNARFKVEEMSILLKCITSTK